ncbi:TerD family protein [Anaeromicrobium sediminis]|uniref:Chemical-damaging agent resistance protein C n=1 Tax=Anaeromicrobium sediminis TaxID=1478221 RepID=A0A267MJJ0_9FIRM|nr:chemical-damaging agent resistance protein C [Anaeromicrobium sediminis]
METPAQSTNLNRPVGEKVSLKKGQKVSLKKMATDAGLNGGTLSKVKVGLGWDLNKYDGGHDFDLDVFTFAVKGDGKVRNSGDFIFFNNMRLSNGSIELMGDNRTGAGAGDDEVVAVDLNTVPADIEKIIFAIIINEAEMRRQNFGMVGNAFVRLVDTNTNKEFLRYDLSEDYSIETAVVVGEIYRHKGEWKFTAIGSGFNDGLPALCACYGVDAE